MDLAEQQQVGIDLDSAFYLIQQRLRAVRALHGVDPEVAHGALAPERLIVTSEDRLVVAEYVLGSALQQSQSPACVCGKAFILRCLQPLARSGSLSGATSHRSAWSRYRSCWGGS